MPSVWSVRFLSLTCFITERPGSTPDPCLQAIAWESSAEGDGRDAQAPEIVMSDLRRTPAHAVSQWSSMEEQPEEHHLHHLPVARPEGPSRPTCRQVGQDRMMKLIVKSLPGALL